MAFELRKPLDPGVVVIIAEVSVVVAAGVSVVDPRVVDEFVHDTNKINTKR